MTNAGFILTFPKMIPDKDSRNKGNDGKNPDYDARNSSFS